MSKEDTRKKILENALELFSIKGYSSTSVDEIAEKVGIKGPSLYNHFSSKKDIFISLVDEINSQYDIDTNSIDIHVHDANKDAGQFENISEEYLFSKLKQIFIYSITNKKISQFRHMMTLEQFSSKEIGNLYTKHYVDRLVNYHAKIFENLLKTKEINNLDPYALALMYVSPVNTLIGICDRDISKKDECMNKLKNHVHTFFELIHRRG
ncbi:MAG TPA: TetR/AcrR family transcriptional regulator [Firmicutes bacterium]|nr:TetR/AcrR family transcriptional regulator [Bacillota bacterium]